ncbi:hypothetical protein [Corallococcus sp. EGB]|uniref:hypothetical protein n=1 Tax=Corallococcus sp. EGB TaxID=1521117 RepID=UPI001CBC9442|nr:hypothetical protein [Corallococcus sp. EGB]
MKRFLLFAGSVIALYLGMLGLLLATAPEHDREGAFAMGFGFILVVGAMVTVGVIALGGALMLLWERFVAKNPKVSRAGVAFAGIILAALSVVVAARSLEPSTQEKRAAQRANELRTAIERHDVKRFSWAVFDRVREGDVDEAERLIAAGPFTEEELLRYQLETDRRVNPEQRQFLVRLGGRHRDFLAKLPYRLRARYRGYERFGNGDLLWLDESGQAFFQAFQSFHLLGDTPEQRAPESTAPVFRSVNELSANIRSSASPMYLLLTIPYLKVFQTADASGLDGDEKARRRSALVLLRQRGLELNAEEKQDPELQAALRASDLSELLE